MKVETTMLLPQSNVPDSNGCVYTEETVQQMVGQIPEACRSILILDYPSKIDGVIELTEEEQKKIFNWVQIKSPYVNS